MSEQDRFSATLLHLRDELADPTLSTQQKREIFGRRTKDMDEAERSLVLPFVGFGKELGSANLFAQIIRDTGSRATVASTEFPPDTGPASGETALTDEQARAPEHIAADQLRTGGYQSESRPDDSHGVETMGDDKDKKDSGQDDDRRDELKTEGRAEFARHVGPSSSEEETETEGPWFNMSIGHKRKKARKKKTHVGSNTRISIWILVSLLGVGAVAALISWLGGPSSTDDIMTPNRDAMPAPVTDPPP